MRRSVSISAAPASECANTPDSGVISPLRKRRQAEVHPVLGVGLLLGLNRYKCGPVALEGYIVPPTLEVTLHGIIGKHMAAGRARALPDCAIPWTLAHHRDDPRP